MPAAIVPEQPVRLAPEPRFDRRAEAHWPARMEVWLIPRFGQPRVRCQCRNLSADGICLTTDAPAALRVGDECHLCTHLPGGAPPAHVHGFTSCAGTIVRVSPLIEGMVELGIRLNRWERSAREFDPV